MKKCTLSLFYVKIKNLKKKMCNISEKTASVDFSLHTATFVKAGQNYYNWWPKKSNNTLWCVKKYTAFMVSNIQDQLLH